MIDRVLQGLDFDVVSFAVCDIRNGWYLDAPSLGYLSLHYVIYGEGEMMTRDQRRQAFSPGHLVICPPGQPLRISVTRGEAMGLNRCAPLPETLHRRNSQGDDHLPGTLIACGLLHLADSAPHGLFDHLPAPVHLAHEGPQVRAIISALFNELVCPQLGSQAMLSALMKQCLILMLRSVDRHGGPLPWLVAMHDPRMARALNAMTRDLSQRVSVDALAELACLGRSAFIEHFKGLFGMPPQRFVAELRLRHAARLLTANDLPIKVVAERVGYRSRSHFSTAFKALMGCDPEHFRQQFGGDL